MVYEEKLERWRELGGDALEPVLASGAVALLDARWIISHAEAGGVLTHRQALPEEAFLSLADLVEAMHEFSQHIPVAVLSYPWLDAEQCVRLAQPSGCRARALSLVARSLVRAARTGSASSCVGCCPFSRRCWRRRSATRLIAPSGS